MVLILPFFTISCGGKFEKPEKPTTTEEARKQNFGKIFGDDITVFGGDPDPSKRGGSGQGIGVNAFLWRAALDTVSFMPLQSADPFGGVIITDWYSPPETLNNRYKLTIYILDTQLRATAIRVSMFKQKRNAKGQWVEEKVLPNAVRDVEDSILTRARELRIAAK